MFFANHTGQAENGWRQTLHSAPREKRNETVNEGCVVRQENHPSYAQLLNEEGSREDG